MPRPPHICTCGKTVAHGERCKCQIARTRARNRRHDATRPSAARRGYGNKWRTARAAFLAIHDRCTWPGCGAPATVVDHVVPHRGDERLFWDQSNWQPLCTHCHSNKKQQLETSAGASSGSLTL
ncbi:HNH endonuclease [uncultured Maritimibacter sp.]|uniref:HNH endonuclease signature motif containing protein n=1 Tax=uncultured Maritimibacter sp. TaxID=991866 RepID=UPI0026111A87|nr:HNH endonuclease [uncultured Maritimibacter sp.]